MPLGFSFDRFDPDLILLSSELSEQDLAKPNIRIFLRAMSQAAIKATALNPNTLLFVGEDQHEVLSAQRAGLIGMRINGSGNEGTLQTMLTDLNEAGFSL